MYLINLIILYLIILFFTVLISKKMNLYDLPNKRKIHNLKIFNTGGVIIYIFYLLIIYLYEFNYNIELIISLGFLFVLLVF